MRLLFVADAHASTGLLGKALAALEDCDADVLLLAGDLCGKELVPIVKRPDGAYFSGHTGKHHVFAASAIPSVEQDLAEAGKYYVHCTEEDLVRMNADQELLGTLFLEKIHQRLDEWRRMVVARVDLGRRKVIMSPGNDDPLEIDATLEGFERDGIISALGKVVTLGPNHLLTLDQVPASPWKTNREAREGELNAAIRRIVAACPNVDAAIFNFHSPPFGTTLDWAPSLTDDLRPVLGFNGGHRMHAGSRAVRDAIIEFGPVLALHGHIHEAPGEERIGRTLCLNPGSEYWNGILHGWVVDLDSRGSVTSARKLEV